MGNNKNKLHHQNNHRHLYTKKKFPWKSKKSPPKIHEHPEKTLMNGSRSINLDKLQQYTANLSAHASHCQRSMLLYGETRQGLASILTGHCSICDHTIYSAVITKVEGPEGYSQWECNLAAVWGGMVTGRGHSRIEETLL